MKDKYLCIPLTIHKQGKGISLLHLVSRVCKDNSVIPSILFSCFCDHQCVAKFNCMICIDGFSIFIPEENIDHFEYFRDLP